MTKLEGEALDNFYKHALFHEFDRLFCIACRDGADKVKEALKATVTRIEWLRLTGNMMENALDQSRMGQVDDPATEDEIAITKDMIEAGKFIMAAECGASGDVLSGDFDQEKVAIEVFRAMTLAAREPLVRC